ncbi:MAG: tetratricopeptide repeat protein [Syntrophobacter sp.]
MGNRGLLRGCLLLCCTLLVLFPRLLHAQAGSQAYQSAARAFQAGNLQDAFTQVQIATLEEPSNLDYQYLLAGIYFRLGRLDVAENIFRVLIRENESAYRKAYFDLANIYSRGGKESDVVEALEKARPVDPGRADYEIGQSLVRTKNYQKAIYYFGRAREKKPELYPRIAVHEAICLFHLKKFHEARDLLKEALKKKMPPETAAELRKLLSAAEDAARGGKPWHINGAVGFQYDNNIFQNPLQQSAGVSGVDDFGFVANVSGRYDVCKSDPWTFGAAYNHYQLTYFEHTDSGVLGARPSFYVLWDHAPFHSGLEYMYSHYWAGSASKADVQSVLPSFVIAQGDHWRTDVRGAVEWRTFYDLNPDDRLYSAALTELYLFQGGKAHVRAGYLLQTDDMMGADRGSYTGNGGMVGFQYPLWKEWSVDLSGVFLWRDYEFDPTSTPTRRRDNEQDLNILVRGPINSNMYLNFLFQHIWNSSNSRSTTAANDGSLDPFNYRRAIFTCFLSFEY